MASQVPAEGHAGDTAPRVERPFEGPAKWAAVVVLALAMAAIAAWALAHPRPAMHLTQVPPVPAPAPAPAASADAAVVAPESTAAEPSKAAEPAAEPKVESPPPAREPARTKPVPAAAMGLNINTATQAQLELLPGVGPALAQRIIADREKNGRYTAIEQLDRVKGIGPKTIEKLRPYIRVD